MTNPVKSHLQYRVPYADTDRMGVIYYANYLIYFEMLRAQLMRDLGFPYTQMEQLGFALPVIEAHVEYKASAGYDDVLDIWGWMSWIRGVRLQVDCEVFCGERRLASGHTIHACLDLKTRRPVRVIPELTERCPNLAAP